MSAYAFRSSEVRHDEETTGASVVARRIVVRALGCALAALEGGEPFLPRGRVRELLERYAGAQKEDFLSSPPHEVLRICLEGLQRQDEEAINSVSEPLEQIGAGLAEVLRMNGVEKDLLVLEIYANSNRDVHRALNVAPRGDDRAVADFFAGILGASQCATLDALRKPNPLRKIGASEVWQVSNELPTVFLDFCPNVLRVLRSDAPSVEAILALFFRCAPPPKLTLSDFSHLAGDVALLQRYLRSALSSQRAGVNILLHGNPGMGKTELARTLAATLGVQLMEVPVVDDDKAPLPPWRRLTAYCAAQESLRHRSNIMMLFDEIEDVFPQESDGPFGGALSRKSSGDRNKGWLTQVIEGNGRPTIWIGNSITHIDSAYLRRFDVIVELTRPSLSARERLARQMFEGLPIRDEQIHILCVEPGLAPAHIQRMADVVRTISPPNEEDASSLLEQLTRKTLQAFDIRSRNGEHARPLGYRADCVNAKFDLQALCEALKSMPVARLCLFGPPGTGKTEWARYLAEQLGCAIHVKRSSDLLGKYVGESESLIRAAFDCAERDNAVLLIDEADSLLRSRESCQHGWEVSMINEMLTAMESFQGIFAASTNMVKLLDEASARRFDFKVEFDYLRGEQVQALFRDLTKGLAIEAEAITERELSTLNFLTPGDFSNVMRQARLLPDYRSPARLISLLRHEQEAKGVGNAKRIGFT